MDLKFVELILAIALAEFDAETRFECLSVKGNVEAGLALLAQLDSKLSKQL